MSSSLKQQLEAWIQNNARGPRPDQYRTDYSDGAHEMLGLLCPLIEAANKLDDCLCEFGDPVYCDDYIQRIHDAIADLHARLERKPNE